jgi:hypothetical protein
MENSDQTCTCVNRKLKPSEAVMWIRPNNTGWITARDCPVHGVTIRDEPVKDVVVVPLDPVV